MVASLGVLLGPVVSWLRTRISRSTPKKCWEESREQYGRRLKRCCEEVNKELEDQCWSEVEKAVDVCGEKVLELWNQYCTEGIDIEKVEEGDRTYRVLESIGTKPNVIYQTKIRNNIKV